MQPALCSTRCRETKIPACSAGCSRSLPPLKVSDAKLQALADAMIDTNAGDPDGNNPNIPAGFTYFGQFVDHDITLDLTSLGDKEKDPLGIENFRTPSVDLDCVYGLGPDGSPHLYARNPAAETSTVRSC